MKPKNKFLKMIHSTYLCIRYPFLYPRNRFNGKHWNDWRIEKYLNGGYEYYSTWKDFGGRQRETVHRYTVPGIKNKAWRFDIDYTQPILEGSKFMGKSVKTVKSYFYVSWYYIVNFVYNHILPIFHCLPIYTEWDAIPDGWRKAFGDQYLKDLKKQLKKDNLLYKFRITQIKEKFGTLHLYCNFATKEVYDIIAKYEDLSWHTCIECGKPATKVSDGWICPYCDEHIGDSNVLYVADSDGNWVYQENSDAENEEKV